jgi:glycosyltransferase involved in cell wall biosynthesis
MVKILLVADLKGWIFERHCNEIKSRLSNKYEIDIAYCRPHGRKINKISENYDIVYVLDPMPLNYPPKDKVIMGCRGEWLHGPGNERSFYEDGLEKGCKKIKDKCSIFHVVNKRQFNLFKGIVTDKPFYLAQHGVNTDIFNENKYTRCNNTDKIVVGTAGRRASNGHKGFDIVKSACESLGIDFLTATYKGNRRSLKEMPSYYNEIDAYVCMSKTEGLCNPIMEAGAMGLPVISTKSGASEEMIFDGQNGLLVERDKDSLIQALLKIKEPDVRLGMGELMSKEILENWSWDVRIRDYDVMFEKILELKGANNG